jgi:hypothetical protein
MREYSRARTSLGVNHYCSQWFYLSSLQVSLPPTKVPTSWQIGQQGVTFFPSKCRVNFHSLAPLHWKMKL